MARKRKRQKKNEKELEIISPIKVKSNSLKRPYGLLSSVGIRSAGLSPRMAWETWNDFRKKQREGKADKSRKSKKTKSIVNKEPKKNVIPVSNKQQVKSAVNVPELSASAISMANSNSHFDRGTVSESTYKTYANKILAMDISDTKKEQLISELKKRWDKLLGYQASWVPWTVSGRANYNAKKLDKADQVMKTQIEISDWFEGVEKSVKESKSQYKDDSKIKAQRAEEWVNSAIESGWYNTPTSIANGLAKIAQYDTQRFIELYESFDKKYKFKKNTNAAKLYEKAKTGIYTGEKKPQKLHETENLNTYSKSIKAGERVFMKFTTRPKPQLVYALKRRGWHWNSFEGAWSIDAKKYDKDFVAGIDENYKKYL